MTLQKYGASEPVTDADVFGTPAGPPSGQPQPEHLDDQVGPDGEPVEETEE